jgi:hypothetical protein
LADDIIITAPTAAALRRALLELQRVTRRWGMRISPTKTKVMVVQETQLLLSPPQRLPPRECSWRW